MTRPMTDFRLHEMAVTKTIKYEDLHSPSAKRP